MSSKREKLIKTNQDVSQIRVTDGLIRDDNGNLYVKISSYPENLLRLIPNGQHEGLVVTYTPPVINNDYYIDSINGDDNNDGTRNHPLRTVLEAFRRIPNISDTYRIFLHENQTFGFDIKNHNDMMVLRKDKIGLEIKAYGPLISSQFPNVLSTGHAYYPFNCKEYPRPTLRFKIYTRPDERNKPRWETIQCNTFFAQGLNMVFDWSMDHLTEDEITGAASPGWNLVKQKTEWSGCYIRFEGLLPMRTSFWTGRIWETISVNFEQSAVDMNPSGNTDWSNYKKPMFFDSVFVSKVTFRTSDAGNGRGVMPNLTPMCPRNESQARPILFPNLVSRSDPLYERFIVNRKMTFNNLYLD